MKTIIKTIPSGTSELHYSVAKGEELSLVLIAISNSETSVQVRLTGRGARAVITGIIVARGDTKVTIHTMQVHEAPDTISDLLIKSVLSDRAKCLYDGGIRVEKAAQKTDAYQRNENLLLTGRAYAESKPSLEILANDVRCTHGSTTGPIDPDQLWYLSTRGISPSAGEKLIVDGFIAHGLVRIGDDDVRAQITKRLSGV